MRVRSLRAKIMLFLAGLSLLSIMVVAFAGIRVTGASFEADLERDALADAANMNRLLDNYKNQALAHVKNIASNPLLADAIKTGEFEALRKVTVDLMKNGGLEYLVVTDPTGRTLIRAHQPDVIPGPKDNISNQENIRRALGDNAFVGIEEGKVVKLSVRAGAPVRDSAGTLLGAVSSGYVASQNSIVDEAKAMFKGEFSLFLGTERVATTLSGKDGKRALGPVPEAEALMKEVSSPALKTDPLLGASHVTAFAPLTGAKGTVIGLVSASLSREGLVAAQVSSAKSIAAATLGVLAAVLFFGWLFSRGIVRPMKRVAELAERARKGDLTISREDFGIRSRDELGVMADSLADMVRGQAETVLEIQKVAGVISTTAENLAALSQETNASMEEVRSHLSEAAGLSESNAASIEESSAGVQEVAGGAQAMAKAALEGASSGEKAGTTATDSVEKVNSVIRDLGTVGEKSRTSVESISQLEGAVKDISGFVNVISSIADQTNLLALNAAIEAARAGDAGRGFAVVADEVRKLAEESARAASEVSKLIQTLEKTTRDSINVTTEAGKIMGDTVSRAQEAGSGLQTALKEIRRVVDTITGIATTSEEQAASSEEMASAMDQLSRGTLKITELVRNISKASEETSSAAEGVAVQAQEMSLRGEELLSKISRFKVRDSGQGSGLVPAPDKGRR